MAPTAQTPETDEDGPDTAGDIQRANRPLNTRQRYFVDLVLSGKSHSEAYRTAYCKPDHSSRQIADQAYALSTRPNVRLALKATRFDQPYHRLLTKDDILKVCAGIIMSETATRHERLRAAQVYAGIAGYVPRELGSLLDPDTGAETGNLRVTVNIFQNAPSRIRAAVPVQAVPVSTNGNGNGNGRH